MNIRMYVYKYKYISIPYSILYYITAMKLLVMLSFYISNLENMYLDRNFDFIVLFNKKMFSARYQAILY